MRAAVGVLCLIVLVPHCAYGGLSIGNVSYPEDPTVHLRTNCIKPKASKTCTASSPCPVNKNNVTFYVPHNAKNCKTSVEGCIETSALSTNGYCLPMTVDCVRFGECAYATCASDPSNYGKFFTIGSVTYMSALDFKPHTVRNVVCYVHDTGGDFKGRPDKFDVPTTVCPTCTDKQAGTIATGKKPKDMLVSTRSAFLSDTSSSAVAAVDSGVSADQNGGGERQKDFGSTIRLDPYASQLSMNVVHTERPVSTLGTLASLVSAKNTKNIENSNTVGPIRLVAEQVIQREAIPIVAQSAPVNITNTPSAQSTRLSDRVRDMPGDTRGAEYSRIPWGAIVFIRPTLEV